MSDIRVSVTLPPDGDCEFALTPHPVLPHHANAWKVERDGTFMGYIYKGTDGFYHQYQPATLLMPEVADMAAHAIGKDAHE